MITLLGVYPVKVNNLSTVDSSQYHIYWIIHSRPRTQAPKPQDSFSLPSVPVLRGRRRHETPPACKACVPLQAHCKSTRQSWRNRILVQSVRIHQSAWRQALRLEQLIYVAGVSDYRTRQEFSKSIDLEPGRRGNNKTLLGTNLGQRVKTVTALCLALSYACKQQPSL